MLRKGHKKHASLEGTPVENEDLGTLQGNQQASKMLSVIGATGSQSSISPTPPDNSIIHSVQHGSRMTAFMGQLKELGIWFKSVQVKMETPWVSQ